MSTKICWYRRNGIFLAGCTPFATNRAWYFAKYQKNSEYYLYCFQISIDSVWKSVISVTLYPPYLDVYNSVGTLVDTLTTSSSYYCRGALYYYGLNGHYRLYRVDNYNVYLIENVNFIGKVPDNTIPWWWYSQISFFMNYQNYNIDTSGYLFRKNGTASENYTVKIRWPMWIGRGAPIYTGNNIYHPYCGIYDPYDGATGCVTFGDFNEETGTYSLDGKKESFLHFSSPSIWR